MERPVILLPGPNQMQLDARRRNILRSPKKGGSSGDDSAPYLDKLGVGIIDNDQPIQFTSNINEHIHRWAPYVQGFSASFVQGILDRHKNDCRSWRKPSPGGPVILDPFAGCGTVLVQAKLNGFRSVGTELNPLLQFIADVKLNCWDVSPKDLLKTAGSITKKRTAPAPAFLESASQFQPAVLKNLQYIKGGIEALPQRSEKQKKIKDLLRVAFSAILIDCSNLKRSPCLGYVKNKRVDSSAPFVLFNQKVNEIADDLALTQSDYADFIDTESNVALANAMNYRHRDNYDLAITSPPYMNGLDYVINYKIEMGWLGFVESQKDLKQIKDNMVVCDNVSKGLIRNFAADKTIYTNDWLEAIRENIAANIARRGAYRRQDMPYIVQKYFDDMFRVMKNVVSALKPGGRFILVVGDSLIADVYVPTDLLLARMGKELGLEIESIEKARDRRSGQIRSYRLRETVITLRNSTVDTWDA